MDATRGSVLLDALARRSDGRNLLRGQGSKGLGDQVRMRLDHRLPADRLHHVGGVPVSRRKPKQRRAFSLTSLNVFERVSKWHAVFLDGSWNESARCEAPFVLQSNR